MSSKKTPKKSQRRTPTHQSPASSSNSSSNNNNDSDQPRSPAQDSFSSPLKTMSGYPISFKSMWWMFRKQGGVFKHAHQQRKLVLAAMLEERVESLISAFAEDLDLFQAVLRPVSASEPSLVSILVPLARLLSSAEFSNSVKRVQVNQIYATVFASDPPFLQRLLDELERELRRFPEAPFFRVDEVEVQWRPAHWGDVLQPVVALFARIFRSVTDARSSAEAPHWVERLRSIATRVSGRMGVDSRELDNAIKNLAQMIPQSMPQPKTNNRQSGPSSSSSFNFQKPSEGPGELRESGIPRHRNDHADFRKIQVLPVDEELTSTVSEYLPRAGDLFLPEGVEGHLARIFRLFREDMISLLREAVKFFLKDVWPKRGPQLPIRQHDSNSGVTLTLFSGCQLNKPQPTLSSALRLSFSFPQPWTLPGSALTKEKHKMRLPKARKEFWQGPQGQRFWQEGSIVVIVPEGISENPPLLLAVVCNRDVQSLTGSEESGEIHLEMMPMTDIRSNDDAGDDASQGLFPRALFPALGFSGNKKVSFTLFQVGKHFFRGYEPILASLQLHVAATFPFADLVVGASALDAIPAPAYIIPGRTQLDLTPIMMDLRPPEMSMQDWSSTRERLSQVPVISSKQLSDHLCQFLPLLCLDQSQVEALSHALTHQMALIAGPPGCGKSYIGVRLVCVLLHNLKNFAVLPRYQNIGGILPGQIEQRSAGSLKPILCLCYTNHALDQFLEDLLDAGVKNVVRIGSRSKSERVMERSLFALCQNSRLSRDDHEQEKKLQKKCARIQMHIEDTWECIEQLTSAKGIGSLLQALKPAIEEDGDDELYADIFGKAEDADGFTLASDKPPELRFLTKDGKAVLRAHLKDWRLSEDQLGMTSAEAIAVSRLREIFHQTDEQLLNVLRLCNGKLSAATEHLFSIKEQEEEIFFQQFNDPPPSSPSSSSSVALPDPVQKERAWRIFQLIRDRTDYLLADLDDQLSKYTEFAKQLLSYRNLRRLQVLQEAEIIGVTTTGASMHNSLLRSLRAAVLIVEEAGEVFESHLIASLSEHTKHLVMIGDHKQLRPKCAVHVLSRDSHHGYDLDVSLFERLALRDFPLATLETQRRMHPEISNLIRRQLYPQLIDHESVQQHPPVKGLQHRLWMVDVKGSPEGQSDKGGSYENVKEAQMTIALVRHLVKQGYQPGQLVVLTPYVGQLLRLNAFLAKENIEILIDERTQAEMDGISIEAEELELEQEEEQEHAHGRGKKAKKPILRSTTLRSCVRLATVDNFQGEEADVIILSTVRNNHHGRLGFLKSDNRVNVMLSRARHGMVIFASVDTVSRSRAAEASLFMDCIRQLQERQRVDNFLPLLCSNHGTVTRVKNHQDFALLSPDGGCGEPCRFRLECGHRCTKSCHSNDRQHVTVRCSDSCIRPRSECQHPCPELCYKPCPPCQELLDTTLSCGHTVQAPCRKITNEQERSKIPCPIEIEATLPFCQHLGSSTKLLCSRYQQSLDIFERKDWMRFVPSCSTPCGGQLACGHACQANCGDCVSTTLKTLKAWDLSQLRHPPCSQGCDRDLYCGHRCPGICHTSPADCGICKQACLNRCPHSQCPLPCNDLCAPCAEPCQWTCAHEHKACPLPCAVPCIRLPCDRRCDQTLPCGHRCPTVCGEPCPLPGQYCRACATGSSSSQVVDLLEGTTLADHDPDTSPLVVLGCGHALTIESADGTFEMSSVYGQTATGWSGVRSLDQLDLKPATFRCPHCRASLSNVRRYGRIVNHLATQHSDRRFAIFSAAEVVRLGSQLRSEEDALVRLCGSVRKPSQASSKQPNTPNRVSAETRKSRNAMNLLLKQIKKLLQKVKNCSSTRVYNLALASLNRQRQLFQASLLCTSVKSGTLPESLALFADAQIAVGCSTLIDPEMVKAADQIPTACVYLKKGLNCYLEAMKEAEVLNCHRALCKICLQLVDSVCLLMYCFLSRGFNQSLLASAFPEHLVAARTALDKASATPQFWSSPTILEETRGRFIRLQKEDDIEILRSVFQAMSREVGSNNRSTYGGHWFTCPNGHIYTIGECGGAMQSSTCPECGAVIGGGSHTLAAGNQRAAEFLQQMEPSSSSSSR